MRSIVFTVLALVLLPAWLPATAAKNDDLSIDDYTKALDKAPPDYKYKYYLYRGKAYARKKKYALAIQDFSASLSFSNSGIEGYIERGKAFLRNKDFGPAAIDFSKALEINPKFTELYRYRAEAFAGSGKFDSAISDAKKLSALNGDRPNYLAFLADIYDREGDYKSAKELCNKALLLDFNNSYALHVQQAAFEHEPEKIVFGRHSKESSKQMADRHGQQVPSGNANQPTAKVPATVVAAAQPRGIHEYLQAARSVTRQ